MSALSKNVMKNSNANVTIIPYGLRRKLALIVLKHNPNKTMAMSPLALRFPLCKLASVARGDALKELRYVLGLTKPEMVIDFLQDVGDRRAYSPPGGNWILSPMDINDIWIHQFRMTNVGIPTAALSIFGDLAIDLEKRLGNLGRIHSVKYCYMQFKNVLDISKESDLMLLNKIYVPYTRDIEHQFIANSSSLFGVYVEKIGFSFPQTVVSFVNRWINSATLHRIPSILDVKDVDKNTTMLILNAIHYKGTWEEPFDIRFTVNGNFRHIDNKISSVPMMTKEDHYDYLNNDDCQMIMMKFASYATTMLFVLPNSAKDLPRIITIMYDDPDWIKNAKVQMKNKLIRVSIPRFKIKSEVDWTEYLKEIGVRKIFNTTNSGLNRMLTRNSTLKNINLNKAKQKIFMDVDELGIGRHVQDEDYGLYTPMMMHSFNIEEFTADKPFYFEVNVEAGNMPHLLVCGVYYGPD